MIKKIALSLLIALNSISVSYADSPLTSTDFSLAYKDVPIVVKAGKTNGILTLQLFSFLIDETKAIDVKMALINKLSWSIEGKDNASLFIEFGLSAGNEWNDYEAFIENASADEKLCLAYLKALDDYFDVNQALDIAKSALILNPNSYTFNIIYALIQAQINSNDLENWCLIYLYPNDVRLDETLERDMKIEAEEIIFEYLSLYKEDDCEDLNLEYLEEGEEED